MKKLILPLMILALTCPFPAAIHASYIIHLENGGQFLTPQYWEEDNYVNFYIVGGTMGIEKNTVRKIEKLPADPYRDAFFRTPEQPLAPAKPAPETAVKGEKDSPEKLGENSEKKRLQEELRKLEADNTAAVEKYQKMSEQDSISKEERDEARKEVFTTNQKKRKLFQKLQGNNQK